MATLTTPRLVLQYQEVVLGLELGLVSRREFKTVVKTLKIQQTKLNRKAELARAKRAVAAEVERQRRIAEEMRIAAAREEARRVRRRTQVQQRRNRIFHGVSGAEVNQFLRRAWEATAGHPIIRVVSVASTGVTRDVEWQRPDTADSFVKRFFVYEGGIYTEYMDEGGLLDIYRPTIIRGQRMRRQMFRDGISHCVFTPLLSRLQRNLEETDSKDRKTRLKQKIARLNILSDEYESGVPVEAMETVAKASGFKIIINDILGKEIYTFNQAGRCGNVQFTNTRPNHIDEGKIVLDGESINVNAREMNDIWIDVRKKKQFYMIEGDLKNNEPRKIRTIDGVYELEDKDKKYFEKMNTQFDIHKCRFNASKYPDVNAFIKEGRIINSWVTPFSDDKPTGHLDMPKAYTQFKKCAWYSGFLGVIHQWRSGNFDRQWIEDNIGLYRIHVKTTNPLFLKLGLTGTHILPSPEILYFMDQGVECSIDAGVWGQRMDFTFDDDMLTDRRYAKWSGRLSMEYHSKKYSFDCERDWAEHIKADYGDDCYYWEDKKLCSVKLPIQNVHTNHHILAFITSYVRIQMMEALKQFDLNQVVKVVLDGIYFKGEAPKCLDWFRPKEIVDHSYQGFAWYSPSNVSIDWSAKWISDNTLLTGQGGAGKTYKVMTDTGFNRILFVSPQHILGKSISEEYNVSYTTINKLIGQDCVPYIKERAYPPVLFIDEVTQIPSEWIDKIFTMYEDSLIILAGDLNDKQWFQCRNGKPGEFSNVWKPSGVTMIEIGGDRRSRDDLLRQLKIDIRNEMKRVFVDGDSNEVNRMKSWAIQHLPLINLDEGVKRFVSGDVWIAGTNKTSDTLLEKGVWSGWYKKGGEIEFVEPSEPEYKKRGSFTIHSFQGRTLKTGKIFISVNDMFEYSMLYTAVSRAVNFDQLMFVV